VVARAGHGVGVIKGGEVVIYQLLPGKNETTKPSFDTL